MRARLLGVRLAIFGGSMLLFAAGCATEPKPAAARPVPGGRVDALDLKYVFPVPPSRAYEAVLDTFRSEFGSSVSGDEKGNAEMLRRFRRYGEVHTQYLQYEKGGKKFRKQCDSFVRLVPEYSGYAEVSVGCKHDVYEFGFARGGIHNLFTQWWDWYPEDHLSLSESLLERVREGLRLDQNSVIRLSNTKVNELPDVVQAIRHFETTKKQK